ncbi:MAG TPA: hypothetical protein VGD78_13305 [Chthoniobacterales bacterium]
MTIRGTRPFNRTNVGRVCAWFLFAALSLGNSFIPKGAYAQEPANPLPPASAAALQTTVVQGAVAQYLMNPDGIVDGLLLENNAIVRFPPHLGQVLTETVSPHDVVRVEGVFEVAGTVHAFSIVDLQNQRAVVDAPPPPRRPRPPRPAHADAQLLNARGTIRVLTRARHGEVDGVVLSDGTMVHFPPHATQPFAALLREGNVLAATGHGTANEYGRSLEAEAVGPSLDQLQKLAPGSRPSAGNAPPSSPQPHS